MEEINKLRIYRERKGKKTLLYTKSILPGKKFFAEKTIKIKGEEYREINPERSKLGAAVLKGLSQTGIKQGSIILYLGASHGYTPSFISDIVGEEGIIFCLDFAPRVVRDLVFVCEERKNMIPLLENASQPQNYKDKVSKVDVVYQDVAQRDQVGIFLDNCKEFLKPGGFGLLAIKPRSIDVTRKPKDIFKEVRKKLEETLLIVDYKELDPYEMDHAFFVVKNK
ncbi:fibrillarin-like rRNA/tRNA 2'-O-methyltransferase [Candidatus Woesearchaeota archaeon]|jgi:fibrillarin-like pre-rRNA processing protein|nr:fibrillarin-like rRNA/tRNA 2'-O-methyltransferase [Candidatus Woesearchaeota archaeon]